MKNLKLNRYLYFLFLFVVILIFSYVNSLKAIESFTPKIRELYRPYIRNIRVMSEGFYNKQKTDTMNLFRKFGIM